MKNAWRALAAEFTWVNILRAAGLAGVAYETSSGLNRPALLVLFGAMMGLADAVRNLNDSLRGKQDKDKDKDRS